MVGDTATDRDLLAVLLGCAGHEIMEARDGAQALDLMETYHPDLVLSDILMPVLDGLGLANRLRADPRFAAIPVMFHTATYAFEEAALLGRSGGVSRVFVKPCQPQDLVDAVHDCLGIPRFRLRPGCLGARPPGGIPDAGSATPAPDGGGADPEADCCARIGWIKAMYQEMLDERDPAAILLRYCGGAQKVAGGAFALLCIPEEDGRSFRYFLPHGAPLACPGHPPAEGTALERLLRQGRAIRMDGAGEAALWGLPAGVPPFRHAMAVPVASHNRTYGWIFLGRDESRGPFSDVDEDLALLLGSRAGMVYEIFHLEDLVREENRRRLQAEGLRRGLRELVMASEDAVISLDPDLRINEWNEGAGALLGYSAKEAWSLPYAALLPPEEQEAFERQVQEARAGRTPPVAEGVRLRKDGTEVPVAFRFSGVRDERGRLKGFTTILHDLTRRRALESSLDETASRLQNLYDNLDEVVWSLDPASRRLLAISPACEKILGHPPGSFISNPALWGSLLHPEDTAVLDRFLADMGAGASASAEFRVRLPDGRPSWVQARGKAVQDRAGRTVRMDGLLRDITDRRASEDSLRRSEARFRSLVESMEDLVCTFDSTLRLTGLYGRPARDLEVPGLLGKGLGRLLPPGPAETFSRLLSQVLAGQPKTVEATDLLEGKCFRVSAAPIPGAGDTASAGGIVAVVHDLTDFLRLQDRLAQQERLVSLGTLVASVAHEVRGPLQAVTGALDLLEGDEASLPPDSLESLDLLRRGIGQIDLLMEDLLAYARTVSLEPQSVPVQALVGEAVGSCRALAAQKAVLLQTALDEADRRLWVDGPRILQVLRNLLENAIQHSSPGAQVVLRAGPDRSAPACWSFAVEDQGAGIRPEDLPRIFDPFFTRRKGGTGLGLAICQRIVAQHGGTLWAENRKEGGARTAFRIPVERPEEPGSPSR